MFIIHSESLSLIPSLGTRITSGLCCGFSSLSRTVSPVRNISHSTAVVSELRPPKVREPLDKIGPNSKYIDPWEVIVYVLALSFSLESESFMLLPRCIL